MSACSDKIQLVHGLFDGELDAVNAAAIEGHLKTCDACNDEYLRLQALRATVAAPGVAHEAPARLRSGIEAMMAAGGETPATASKTSGRSGSEPSSVRRFAPWAAGGLGSLLAASLALTVVVPQVAENNVEQQLVASHVRSLLASHLTDIGTSNEHVVRPWFNGKVDIAPPVPELSPQGFPLVGGRLDYIQGRVTPTIVYKRRLHTVNLFVWPAEGRLLNETRAARHDGYSLLEWTEGGLRFAAVSDIDPADLKLFKAAYVAHSPDTSH